MRFERSEKFILLVTAVLFALCAMLAWIKHISVDVARYDFLFVLDAILIGLGQLYRRLSGRESAAAGFTAFGLLLLGSQALVLFNALLLPYRFHGMDQILAGIDGAMGFVWSDYVIAMSAFPAFCAFLKIVYTSTFIQIVLALILLSFAGRPEDVRKLTLANFAGGVIVICIWSLFPSSTPVAFQALPPDVAAIVDLKLSREYGLKLVQMSYEGISRFSLSEKLGMVGFPSFHTVMALLVVFYAGKVRFMRFPLIGWNLFMLLAIPLHGAHNVIDVMAGFAVAGLAIWISGKVASNPAPLFSWPKSIPGAGQSSLPSTQTAQQV
jgi:PAP2 superfamily